MRRREFIALLGCVAVAWPLAARAQQTGKVYRIGLLGPASTSPVVGGFHEGLRELGYIEGQNVHIEYRWAEGKFDQLPGLAAELVRLDVDVIVAFVTQASLAAKMATRTIPIVMVGVADPVGVGLVASLAYPGGNVTGTSAMSADVVGKQLELLKEVVPDLSSVAVLWNPANPVFQTLQLRQAEAASRTLGVHLQILEARWPNEFEAAFAAMHGENTRALLVLSDPLFILHHDMLLDFAAKARLVAVSGNRGFVEAGGLMAYGPSYFHVAKRAAKYVDRILKGAKPADLPVEQPTSFELVVNLRTAKALGLDIPSSFLARADEVIE